MRKYRSAVSMQGGFAFQPPRGYKFVRIMVNSFQVEYWLWPFHYLARWYYRKN